MRGELVINAFNRWRLLDNGTPSTHWTFADAGQTAAVAGTELALAKREAGDIVVASADELTAEETTNRIEAGLERPDLLLAQRDWGLRPEAFPWFSRMLPTATRRGAVVHVVAAFGSQAGVDDLYFEARRRWRRQREPLGDLAPRTSNIERRFGERLRAEGFDPKPQMPLANYFLDFAVVAGGRLPVRLDVEVDGRHWHEELPGRHGPRDERRNRIVKCLGWRPVRLWADDIESDESGCVARIRREAASPKPSTASPDPNRRTTNE
ncbi:MAG: DUF559 domain-containing protein [Gammaproteobacteria bacterium]|nr:DUF559 domain-containing protein [Gammaproteobacteria bacterium]